MKKTELKVGEEYAVFLSPGAVRRFLNGSYYSRAAPPLRVTLLAVDATETMWERGSYAGAYSKRQVKGHKVSIPENGGDNRAARKTIRIHIYKSSVEEGMSCIMDDNSDRRGGTVQIDWTREFLMLENAGCFISTWADYEARMVAQEQARVNEAERKRLARMAADEQAPAVEAKLQAVLDRLADFGEVSTRGYSEDEAVRYITVDGEGFKVSGDVHYKESEVVRSVKSGATFKLGLNSLALLLGIEP